MTVQKHFGSFSLKSAQDVLFRIKKRDGLFLEVILVPHEQHLRPQTTWIFTSCMNL